MIITEKSKVISNFTYDGISEEKLESLFIPKYYQDIAYAIAKSGGKYYYLKCPKKYGLINELIGSYLAKRIGLDTVDYQIALPNHGSNLLAFSEIFYKKGYQYISVEELFKRDSQLDLHWNSKSSFKIYGLENSTLEFYKNTPLFSDLLKLIAVDLKMGQWDRNSSNMQIKIDSLGTIDLAPLFDYENAYSMKKEYRIHYANPFIDVQRNRLSLEMLFRKYNELWDYIQFLKKISIEDILEDISREKAITFTPEEISHYQKCQRINDKIKRI